MLGLRHPMPVHLIVFGDAPLEGAHINLCLQQFAWEQGQESNLNFNSCGAQQLMRQSVGLSADPSENHRRFFQDGEELRFSGASNKGVCDRHAGPSGDICVCDAGPAVFKGGVDGDGWAKSVDIISLSDGRPGPQECYGDDRDLNRDGANVCPRVSGLPRELQVGEPIFKLRVPRFERDRYCYAEPEDVASGSRQGSLADKLVCIPIPGLPFGPIVTCGGVETRFTGTFIPLDSALPPTAPFVDRMFNPELQGIHAYGYKPAIDWVLDHMDAYPRTTRAVAKREPRSAPIVQGPVTVTFPHILRPGDVTVKQTSAGPAPFPGYMAGTPSVYYDVSTTTEFAAAVKDPVTVCIDYSGTTFRDEPRLALFHFENVGWVDVTSSRDPEKNVVCGNVQALSLFALFEPQDEDPVADAGPDQTVQATGPEGALDAWAKRNNATSREVVRLFEKVASALDAAHGQGIFNRDLKPSNILVRAKDGEPIVGDWGAGQYAMAKELTEGPVPPGTWVYRSPEARRFERENRGKSGVRYEFKATDDLYAVGVTMLEVLTGQEPTPSAVLVPANKANPNVPQVFSDVVRKLMAEDPRHRYATAEALRRDLQRLAALEGKEWDIPLPKPGASKDAPVVELNPRAARFRRIRWKLGAVGLAGVALAVGGALVAKDGKPAPLTPPRVQAAPKVQQSEPPSPGPQPNSEAAPSSSSATASASSSTLPTSVQKEPSSVKFTNATQGRPAPTEPKKRMSRAEFLTWCATLSAAAALQAGCPAAQVRPESGACPQDALDAMYDKLELNLPSGIAVAIDKNQLANGEVERGVYREGAVTGLVLRGKRKLVKGTELLGRLWITDKYVIARYTEARLPDDTRVPVCVTLADPNAAPGFLKREGSKPDAAVAYREGPATAVSRWADVSAYREE